MKKPGLMKRPQRKGRTPGVMNKTEKLYADRLEIAKQTKEILSYGFEQVTFKIAPKTTYTPDFMVIYPGHIEFHEVKGFLRESGNIKFKATAAMHPEFGWKMIRYNKKVWELMKEI